MLVMQGQLAVLSLKLMRKNLDALKLFTKGFFMYIDWMVILSRDIDKCLARFQIAIETSQV